MLSYVRHISVVVTVADLLHNADIKLFTLIFPPPTVCSHCFVHLKLVILAHRNFKVLFNLSRCNYKLYKESFVNRYFCFFFRVTY